MKTSTQIIEKFEEVVKNVQESVEEISKLPKKQQVLDNLPVDKQLKLTASLSIVFALGWVLGCEEELKQFKVLLSLGSLEGLFGDKK